MTSRNYGIIVFLGLFLIFTGMAILSISGTQSTSGFFFVFPFFFFGDPNPMGLIFLVVMVVVTFIFLFQFNRFGGQFEQHKSPHTTVCRNCNELLPLDAAYCLRCGNPVENDSSSEFDYYQQ